MPFRISGVAFTFSMGVSNQPLSLELRYAVHK